jgi:hypothetical protein
MKYALILISLTNPDTDSRVLVMDLPEGNCRILAEVVYKPAMKDKGTLMCIQQIGLRYAP